MSNSQALTAVTPSRVLVGLFALALIVVMATTNSADILPRVAAISALAIALFATRVLPETVTALLSFLAFIAIAAAPPDVIFSGFASSGFWLLFSGLVIGTAITLTGLGRQVALRIFAHTGTSYKRAALLLAISGFGLGLLVPSTIPRVIVLLPIAASLAETMGYKTGSRGHIGLCAMAATTTLLPTYAFLTANLPTIIEFGAIETLYGLKPSYAEYFVQQLPINIVRFAALLVILLPFAPDRAEMASEMPKATPFTDVQRRLLAVLGVAILFWATDSWHQISPAWIALTAATALLVPAFGMLDKGVMKSNIDMSPAFFLAGVFCVSAVAAHSGLSTHVADALIPRMGLGQGSMLKDFYAITGFSVLISHLATAPAAPVILAPLAEPIATAAGWSVKTVAMAQVVGIATPLLPYQAPPLIIAIGLAQIPIGALVRICVLLAVAVAVIGIPLTYVWWQFLGVL